MTIIETYSNYICVHWGGGISGLLMVTQLLCKGGLLADLKTNQLVTSMVETKT